LEDLSNRAEGIILITPGARSKMKICWKPLNHNETADLRRKQAAARCGALRSRVHKVNQLYGKNHDHGNFFEVADLM